MAQYWISYHCDSSDSNMKQSRQLSLCGKKKDDLMIQDTNINS